MTSLQRALLAGLLLVGSVLILLNLGNRYLWTDEAETALLGRNIVRFGLPKAWDGRNLVSQELGLDYGDDWVWRWTPWLPKYVAAGSFLLFGESTLTARLPFALMGILSLALFYLLTVRVFKDPWTALLAVAFLALSVPFLLYVRQCRYYSVAILASLCSVHALFGLLEGRRRSAIGLVLSLTALFHSNYLIFIATLASWAVAVPAFFPRREAILRVGGWSAAALLLNAPWLFYFGVFNRPSDAERIHSFAENLGRYYVWTNRFAFPLVAVLLLALLLIWVRRRTGAWGESELRPFLFLLTCCLIYVAVIAMAPWSFFRYLVGLLPLFALLLAFVCRAFFRQSVVAGALVTLLLLLSGLPHTLSALPVEDRVYERVAEIDGSKPMNVWFPLYNYLDEVTHDFDGPIEAMIGLLRERGRPGDRVFISYGDLPLKFYTDFEVRGGLTGERLTGWKPDWIFERSFFRFVDRPTMAADAARMRQFLMRLPSDEYRRVLDPEILDLSWENIPEPAYHRYRTPQEGRPIRIMERRRDP